MPEFNFESDYIRLYFGSDFKHELNYDEFTEFIQGFLQAHSIQAFWAQRKQRNGFVTPDGKKTIYRNFENKNENFEKKIEIKKNRPLKKKSKL